MAAMVTHYPPAPEALLQLDAPRPRRPLVGASALPAEEDRVPSWVEGASVSAARSVTWALRDLGRARRAPGQARAQTSGSCAAVERVARARGRVAVAVARDPLRG